MSTGSGKQERQLRDLERVLQAARDFNPARLTAAREMAGLGTGELAGLIHATPSAVTQFEKGTARPKPETVIRLSLALGVPPSFFSAAPLPQLDMEACHFRSLRSTTIKERRRVVAHGTAVKALFDYLDALVHFPPEQISEFCRDSLGDEQIENLAQEVRDRWGLGQGPIAHMVTLLEAKGVVAVEVPGHSAKLDAFSVWAGEVPMMFLTPEKNSGSRRRFDCAHEFAHLLLHRGWPTGDAETERQANLFASAFLLPRGPFQAECPRRLDWVRLRQLKARWGVSLAALVRRAYELGIFSEATYRRAYSVLNQRGWRAQEPDEPPLERPALLPRAVELVARAGYTLRRIADELSLGEGTLQRLLYPGAGASAAAHDSP